MAHQIPRKDRRTISESPVMPVQNYSSSALLGDASEVRISHQGEVYRLRCTRNGKLILTK